MTEQSESALESNPEEVHRAIGALTRVVHDADAARIRQRLAWAPAVAN